jgi:hypothetical protein
VRRKSASHVAEHQPEPQYGFEACAGSVVKLVEIPNIILLPPDSVSRNLSQLAKFGLSVMMYVAQAPGASNGELGSTWKETIVAWF